MRHLLRVAQPVLVEEVELVPCPTLLGREPSRWWATGLECLGNLVRNGGGHVGVYAEQFAWHQQRHLLRDGVPPITALGNVLLVSEALHQHHPGARNAL